jgi:hypothetical protein
MSGPFGSLTILAVAALAPLVGAQHQSMPPGMSHAEHLKQMSRESEMKERGNLAMGFDQEKVSHHFYLTRTGGSIEAGVNQDADEVTRKQIRDHLKTIAQEFRDGVFTSPIATHGEVPPGVSVLRERKARITYAYEETPNGARVIIGTTDRAARASLHDFLKYQIREHATSDPVSVQK